MVLVCAHLIGSAAAFAIGQAIAAQNGRSFTRQVFLLANPSSGRRNPGFCVSRSWMLGGAIGVGVAYPLDTLKTKTQTSAGGSMPSNPFLLTRQIFLMRASLASTVVSSTMLGQL